MKKILTPNSILSLLLLLVPCLASCNKSDELPAKPDSVTNTDDLGSGTPTIPDDGNDDITDNPGDDDSDDGNDDVTDPGPIVETVTLSPSHLKYKDTTLVYRKILDPVDLNYSEDGENIRNDDNDADKTKCHALNKGRCVKNKQVIFQFYNDDFNRQYPKELWRVTKATMKASFISIGLKKRDEFFCSLDLKLCSGRYDKSNDKASMKWIYKNPKFWTGKDGNHVTNDLFRDILAQNKVDDDLWMAMDQELDLSLIFNLSEHELRTYMRKSTSLKFSVTDDTFVEDPELSITIERRQPRS